MPENKSNILKEKIQYLVTTELIQRNFEVKSVDADIQTYTPQTTSSESPTQLVEGYDLFLIVDYDGPIDSFEPSHFSRDIQKVCNLLRDAVTQYTITQKLKIVKGDDNVYCSDAFIISMEFEYEETHIFNVNFKLTYPE
jgi:hypothetical protein